MRFADLRLAYKLVGFFLIIVLFLTGVGFVGFYASKRMAESMQVMYETRMKPMHIIDTCRMLNKETQAITAELLLVPVNEADQISLQAQVTERFNEIDGKLLILESLFGDKVEKQWLAELWREMTDYRAERRDALRVALAGDHSTARRLYEEKAMLHLANMDALLQVLADRSADLAEQQNDTGYRLAAWAAPTIIAISFACVILVLILGWLINRLVAYPLTQMLGVVEEVAAGKYEGLAEYIPVHSQDEIGKLAQGFYRMSLSLQKYLGELEEKNRQIFAFAYEDSLTGLPNRRQFIDRMGVLTQKCGEEFALLFIDLDRFKDVNDTMGHSSGDTLLAAVAKRLSEELVETDTIARLGGDEFIVIHTGSQEDISHLAGKMLQIFQKPVYTGENVFHITTSIGISMFPRDGTDVDSLLRAADTAMYAAKRQGKNEFRFFTQDMHEAVLRRTTLEKKLRMALENEELDVFFQPKVDAMTGEITGVEALARWYSGELGPVSPAEFIPVAEETDLIIPLGTWVLRRVCTQNKKWQQAGLPMLRAAVNLSPKQFRQPLLVETIAAILAETQLDARYLELEITEGALMDNSQATIDILRRLKDLGVFIAIDDFGTGYSSLEYLNRFPIDCLKVDKTFIDEINCHENRPTSNIIRAIILLGESLNLKVVAEGVETEEQLQFLRSQNCNEIQGYYFYKPLSGNDFGELLLEKRNCQNRRAEGEVVS